MLYLLSRRHDWPAIRSAARPARHDPNTDEGYFEFIRESARAELERRRISRLTKDGLRAARANGKILGRSRKLNDDQVEALRRLIQAEEDTITGLARKHKIGRSTLSRALNRKGAP